MASRLPLCVLIVLCVSQLAANGAQPPSRHVGRLDALNIHKQRGQKFVMGAKQAVSEKLMDSTGTGVPTMPSTGSGGGTKSSEKSSPSGSTDQPPSSFGTTKAPGQKDAFAMTPLNRVLLALIALVLVIDVILIWVKCKKN
uniref:Uncharacterized protein n=1 Tax=Globodera rostochiensis TaxID=31243 RepID=A0A914I8D9_GLORO